MRLVPDPHKTRHKKMTGELIPSSSCNGVSSPYSGLLLRLEVWSQLPGCLGWGQPSLLYFILYWVSYPHRRFWGHHHVVPDSWQSVRPSLDNVTVSMSSSEPRRMSHCHTSPHWLHHTSHSCHAFLHSYPADIISIEISLSNAQAEWLDVMVNRL